MTPRWQDLHDSALLIDGLIFNCDGDISALCAGNVAAANITVSGFNADFEQACDDIAVWLSRCEAPDSPWLIVDTVEDICRARAMGRIGLIMGWQNMRPIGDRINRVRLFRGLGIRVMQLTYNERNFIANGCLEPNDDGLSNFGRDVIAEMNSCGIGIDLSHVGHVSALEAAERSTAPVLLTHANSKTISDVPRNKSDVLITSVAERGGIIGLSVYGPMCWNGETDQRPRLEDFYRHLEHVARLVGTRHIALGTDFPAVADLNSVRAIIEMTLTRYPAAISRYAEAFGNDVRTRYLSDCESHRDLGNITRLLVEKGWGDDDIRAFLGENYLRVLKEIWGATSE